MKFFRHITGAYNSRIFYNKYTNISLHFMSPCVITELKVILESCSKKIGT